MSRKSKLERSQNALKTNNAKKPWVRDGVSFRHGTKFQAEHKGRIYNAVVDDGTLLYKGKRYTAPTPAAAAVTGTSRNGWTFWKCQAGGKGSWVLIDSCRKAQKRKTV